VSTFISFFFLLFLNLLLLLFIFAPRERERGGETLSHASIVKSSNYAKVNGEKDTRE
jgi:hypothetical protein